MHKDNSNINSLLIIYKNFGYEYGIKMFD